MKELLFKAARIGDHKTIDKILTKNPSLIDAQDGSQRTALSYAVRNKNLKAVDLLLKKGASAAIKDWSRSIPLHDAIYEPEIVKLLLKHDKSLINYQDASGYTALFWSIKLDLLEAIEILLENGADVTIRNDYDSSSLHEAVENRNLKLTNLLCKYGAQSLINSQDHEGKTPLHLVMNLLNSYQQSELKILSLTELLLTYNADINVKDKTNKTALDYAAKFKSFSVFKLLCSRGAEVNESIRNTKTYNKKAEFKQIIDLALELKPLMQIIKNLFVKGGVADLLEKSKLSMPISTLEFESFSEENDDSTYQEFCNYYEMPIKYFQVLLSKEMSKSGPKELQNLPNIIHNNIEVIQIFNLKFFKNSAGKVISFKQHLYENSTLDKICANNEEEKDYSVILLKYLAIIEILKMLENKETNKQEVTSKIPTDLWSEIVDFNEIISPLGELAETES